MFLHGTGATIYILIRVPAGYENLEKLLRKVLMHFVFHKYVNETFNSNDYFCAHSIILLRYFFLIWGSPPPDSIKYDEIYNLGESWCSIQVVMLLICCIVIIDVVRKDNLSTFLNLMMLRPRSLSLAERTY